ncbi:hypothetical protein CPB84DRAFT_1919753 [Gymnopilus junonius]|uniref:Uncharacterized protein n=1 Tax=Gymnopilus junonius TaxID=109634 RepID=A0A9P5NKF7_GYMJU|nr:hypothetical protein CPB84DRAFT_1919753 [Gymnopilus junonius]
MPIIEPTGQTRVLVTGGNGYVALWVEHNTFVLSIPIRLNHTPPRLNTLDQRGGITLMMRTSKDATFLCSVSTGALEDFRIEKYTQSYYLANQVKFSNTDWVDVWELKDFIRRQTECDVSISADASIKQENDATDSRPFHRGAKKSEHISPRVSSRDTSPKVIVKQEVKEHCIPLASSRQTCTRTIFEHGKEVMVISDSESESEDVNEACPSSDTLVPDDTSSEPDLGQSTDLEADSNEPSTDAEMADILDGKLNPDGEPSSPLPQPPTTWLDPHIQSAVFTGPFKLHRQLTVSYVKYLTELPSYFPIHHAKTAFLVDLSDPKFDIKHKNGDLLTVDALVKNTDQDSWRGPTGASDSHTMLSIFTGEPILCRRSRLHCGGIYGCERLNPNLLEEHWELNPRSLETVVEAQIASRVGEADTPEKRALISLYCSEPQQQRPAMLWHSNFCATSGRAELSLTKIDVADWDELPATTNLNESQHHFTNLHTGTGLSLLEAIIEARDLDERVAQEIQLSLETGVLKSNQSDAYSCMSNNVTRATNSSRKAHETRERNDALDHIKEDLNQLAQQKKEITTREKELKASKADLTAWKPNVATHWKAHQSNDLSQASGLMAADHDMDDEDGMGGKDEDELVDDTEVDAASGSLHLPVQEECPFDPMNVDFQPNLHDHSFAATTMDYPYPSSYQSPAIGYMAAAPDYPYQPPAVNVEPHPALLSDITLTSNLFSQGLYDASTQSNCPVVDLLQPNTENYPSGGFLQMLYEDSFNAYDMYPYS